MTGHLTQRDWIRLEAERPDRPAQHRCEHPELGEGGWGHPWPDEPDSPHACCSWPDHCIQIKERRVALATTHNGFWLSHEAIGALIAAGYAEPSRLPRDHPALVDIVERLGDAAGGPLPGTPLEAWGAARLRVATIPADADWVIEEHDGAEWIASEPRWTEDGPVPRHSTRPWERSAS